MLNINKIIIKTLCENTAADLFFLGEWGLSILIDTGDSKPILFDTGSGKTILHNACVLGVDFSKLDKIVLSHGHLDHNGGLRPLLERISYIYPNREIDIICHPAALEPKYIQNYPRKNFCYLGLPYNIEELKRLGAKFNFSKKPFWITDDIAISGEIPMTNKEEQVSQSCYIKRGDKYIVDLLIDDQAIYIKTNMGLIVILGCAHRGIINTLYHGMSITNMKQIFLVIGGAHLAKVSKKRLDFTISELKKLNVKKLGVSHCTGLRSSSYLSNNLFSKTFFYNNAGTTISFEEGSLKVNGFEQLGDEKE